MKSCCTNAAQWWGYFAHHTPNIWKHPDPDTRTCGTTGRSSTRIIRHQMETSATFAGDFYVRRFVRDAAARLEIRASEIVEVSPGVSSQPDTEAGRFGSLRFNGAKLTLVIFIDVCLFNDYLLTQVRSRARVDSARQNSYPRRVNGITRWKLRNFHSIHRRLLVIL